jgi:large subunit ribosomal protein L21
MYAIIKTGGKQYRVQHGETLLIERLPEPEGATVDLQPLLIVDGDDLKDGDALESVSVQATIVARTSPGSRSPRSGPPATTVRLPPPYRRR